MRHTKDTSHRRIQGIALLAALACLALSTEVVAEAGGGRSAAMSDADQTEARERYTRGIQLVNEANYQAALIEMQRAYSLSPSYKILYNLGQIYAHLNDYAAAQTNFERYLSEGGSDIPSPRVNEVNQEIAKLRPRVASVELDVKGDGAEVLIDDAVVGRSPFHKTVLVNAGKHKFSASRLGTEPVTRVMPLAGEDRVKLELDASSKSNTPTTAARSGTSPKDAAADKKLAASQDAPAAHGSEGGSSYVWLGWTLTGALGVGAGIAGYFATKSASELKDLRESPSATRQSLDDQGGTTFRAALVTDVLLGAAVITGGISLYYSLSNDSSGKERNPSQASLAVGPNSVWLRHTF